MSESGRKASIQANIRQLAATLGQTPPYGFLFELCRDKLEYTVSGLSVTLSSNGLASGESEGYLADAALVLEVPTSFAWSVLPPLRMQLRVQAKYLPKF
jgi:hypothetical protein